MANLVKLQVVDEAEGEYLRVGDLAKEAGKTVRAMHLYEEMGLLKPAVRSKGGFRLYRTDAVLRVRWIGKLQEMGFSLNQIWEVLRGWEESSNAPGAMLRVREIYVEKLKETRDQLTRLTALEQELSKSLGYLDTCESCDPLRLIASCCCCDVHHDNDRAPDLVAGLHGR